VEQAFGVLQAQYAIIQFPGRLWEQSDLASIMKTVIILHNMTIEDKAGSSFEDNFDYHQIPQTQMTITTPESADSSFDAFLLHYQLLRDIYTHNKIKADLIEHLWAKHGIDGVEE
jgi:hypothetical protein